MKKKNISTVPENTLQNLGGTLAIPKFNNPQKTWIEKLYRFLEDARNNKLLNFNPLVPQVLIQVIKGEKISFQRTQRDAALKINTLLGDDFLVKISTSKLFTQGQKIEIFNALYQQFYDESTCVNALRDETSIKNLSEQARADIFGLAGRIFTGGPDIEYGLLYTNNNTRHRLAISLSDNNRFGAFPSEVIMGISAQVCRALEDKNIDPKEVSSIKFLNEQESWKNIYALLPADNSPKISRGSEKKYRKFVQGSIPALENKLYGISRDYCSDPSILEKVREVKNRIFKLKKILFEIYSSLAFNQTQSNNILQFKNGLKSIESAILDLKGATQTEVNPRGRFIPFITSRKEGSMVLSDYRSLYLYTPITSREIDHKFIEQVFKILGVQIYDNAKVVSLDDIKVPQIAYAKINNTLDQYVEDIHALPEIANDELDQLVMMLKKNLSNHILKNEIINFCLKNILYIAQQKQYQWQQFQTVDLIQAGIDGVIRSVEKFDINNTACFKTYSSSWISTCIQEYIYNNNTNIRVPIYVQKELSALGSFIEKCLQNNGTPPSIQRISEEFDYSLEKVQKLLTLHYSGVEQPVAYELDKYQLFDITPYRPSLYQREEYQEIYVILQQGIETLSLQEKAIIELYYFHPYEIRLSPDNVTLESISKELGYSLSYIKTKISSGKDKLKKYLLEHGIDKSILDTFD